MSDFKNLKVWKKAHELAIHNFRLAGGMSGPGAGVLRNQWVRAAISVPTNIAEGTGKQSDPEFIRFLRIALGSLTESEYHLILARDLDLIGATDFEIANDKTQSVGKMLASLIKAIKRDIDNRRKPPRTRPATSY
jgi:four helix bundle protein